MVRAMPKLVYLDSSDFSKLSAPGGLSPENKEILAALREHKRAGTAIFFLSPFHISEAVHAAQEHKEAAVQRAALMRELCGSNILRLPTDLPKLELQKALGGEKNARLSPAELTSSSGEWFGAEVPLDEIPSRRATARREIDSLLFSNLPRHERRRRRSELDFRKKSSHPTWRQLLKNAARSSPVPFPYNLVEQDTVISWLLGEITDRQYRTDLLKIIHDPYVMFKYLLDEEKHRQQLYEALRKQGRDLADNTEISALQLITGLLPFAKSEIRPDLTIPVKQFFDRSETLRQIISSYDVNIEDVADQGLKPIIRSCPSLFVITETYRSIFESRAYSYLDRIRSGNNDPKPSKPSDFGDLLHCY